MWLPSTYINEPAISETLLPEEVLYEIDEPTTYTSSISFGRVLVHWCDKGDGISRYVVSPTSSNIVSDLEAGRKSIMEALDQPWIWIADVDKNFNIVRFLRTSIDSIPPGVLPERDVMLSPELEPAFSIKLSGSELSHDFIPASVIRRAVDGAYSALKKMTEKVLEAGTPTGRPADNIREIFDLPMQRVARGSFEVCFGMPKPRQGILPFAQGYAECLEDIGGQMASALRWAKKDGGLIASDLPDIQLLEAIDKLAPPIHGIVEVSKISGALFDGSSYTLTRSASDRIKRAISIIRLDQETIVQLSGKVREFDKDKYSFMLRETSDSSEYKCVVSEETYDDAYDAFHRDAKVNVVARKARMKQFIEILAVSEYNTQKKDD